MGQFKSGQQKPEGSGRKRGVPNKRSIDLESGLAKHGLDVVGKIAQVLPTLPTEKQADVLIDLLGYLYPKRRAIEQNPHESTIATPVKEMTKQERCLAIARMERLKAALTKDPILKDALNTVASDLERQASELG